jgi:hypothetical protein
LTIAELLELSDGAAWLAAKRYFAAMSPMAIFVKRTAPLAVR